MDASFDVLEARQHIFLLAKRYNIFVIRSPNTDYCWALLGVVFIPYVRSKIDYIVALHEIGHVRTENLTRARSDAERYISEVHAWEWAKKTAIVWDDSCDAVVKDCLISYREFLKKAMDSRSFLKKWWHRTFYKRGVENIAIAQKVINYVIDNGITHYISTKKEFWKAL